jgi:putative transposase
MGHTYTNLIAHVVFSTKTRQPFITPSLRESLHPYLGGIVRNLKGTPLCIGGVEDHVHILAQFHASLSISEVVGKAKSGATNWMHENRSELSQFAWQTGYAAFSVGHSAVRDVCRYIENQEEHHRKVTFQQELRALLDESGIAYDERYIWA